MKAKNKKRSKTKHNFVDFELYCELAPLPENLDCFYSIFNGPFFGYEMWYLFLFATGIGAETIYTVRTGGTCETPSSPIIDQTICETQAAVQNWPGSVTLVGSSKTLPQGCIFRQNTQDIRLYASATTTECSNDFQCLCEINAPVCKVGVNQEACICETVLCTSSTGLVCSNGECTHAAPCLDGANTNVCKCGASDCTPRTGLMCSDNTCQHAEMCTNTDGTLPNSALCQCGTMDCPPTLGNFCHQQQNTCIQACPAGSWVNNLECTACTIPGYYCPAGGTLSETQFPCSTGRFSTTAGIGLNSQCLECAAGLYSTEESMIECVGQCSQGQYSSETGLVSNEQCLGRCAAGRYSSERGLTSECVSLCAAGHYSDEIGLTSAGECKKCSQGTYSSEVGRATNCPFLCTPGSFSDVAGITASTQCKICSANKYQDEWGMTQCKGCPDERIIKDTTSSAKHDNLDDCIQDVPDCQKTEYIQNNKCTSCQPSFECDGTAMTKCKPGYFCTGDGIATPCPTGKYGENVLENSEKGCQLCHEGSYQNVVGQTWCSRGCPRGKFGKYKGSSTETEACQPCPSGHMCPSLFMNRPIPCPIGQAQRSNGSEICVSCPINTYANTMATTTCTDCGRNKLGELLQTSGMGANNFAQCTIQQMACQPGSYPAQNICTQCRPGLFGNSKGTTCHLCPSGYYQPEKGQTTCSESTSGRCKQIAGCADNSEILPQLWFDSVVKTNTNIPPTEEIFTLLIYIALFGTIVLIIMTHRLCPQCFRHADIMFSGDHVIEDTHARRILNTRLGAAMTLSIPFVVAGIAVFVFTSDNTLTNTGMIPIVHQGQYNFNNIDIQLQTESPNKQPNCADISVNTLLDCSHSVDSTTFSCIASINCNITSPFIGTNTISITIPNTLQQTIVSIVPSEWNYTKINVSRVLNPTFGLNKISTVNIGVFRSLFSANNIDQYGLQIVPHQVIMEETTEAIHSHQIDLQFNVDENMFVHTITTKLGIVTRLGTILTLTISALSVLRVTKLCLGATIDKCFTQISTTPPVDVQTRNNVLMELTSPTVHTSNQEPPASTSSTPSQTNVYTDTESGCNYVHNPLTVHTSNQESPASTPSTPSSQTNVYTDTESGCNYVHNPLTAKSKWVESKI